MKLTDFIATGKRGLVQRHDVPADEYQGIIYGPEYTLPENMDRMRNHGPPPTDCLRFGSSPWAWKASVALSRRKSRSQDRAR